jgi:predicted RNA-binding protein with RPS1 domain
MATKYAERISSDIIDKAVNELIMQEENKGFKRGELKPFVEMLEEKYKVPFNTIKNRYYREVKDKVKKNPTKKTKTLVVKKEKDLDKKAPTVKNDENKKAVAIMEAPPIEIPVQEVPKDETPKPKPLSIDESVMAHSQKPAEKIFSFPKDYYKLGQLVEVKVVNIQSYGCFCEITDGRGFQALCHISELVNGFIKKVTDYVEVGDVIQNAKICLIDSKRINITMKHLHLKKKEEDFPVQITLAENPPINNLGDKLSSLKEKILARAVENQNQSLQPNDEKEVEELFAEEGLNESQEKIIQKYERDIEEMTSYLQEQLGVLTPQAKLELANIIEEQGVFKTTRGILKTQDNFKADIGLLFMRQMKEKIGEYL